jgi:hypothetical protein
MQLDLDNFFKETSERLYNRLVRAYNIRMKNANDKEYTHKQYEDYCYATLELKFRASKLELILENLEHNYKLGRKFENSIKSVRKEFSNNQEPDNSRIVDETDELKFSFIVSENESTNQLELENISTISDENAVSEKKLIEFSDEELVRIFSEFKAYQRFYEFLNSQKQDEISESELSEIPEKSKDFTTARQVLAVHYLLKYAQVKNVDKTEIARFIQFLTGKNYDNIYKKLQNPFKINDKFLKEDLRFIRDYFERLGMSEVVRMINGEMG